MFDSENLNEWHNQVTNKFLSVLNKHAPLKKKSLRGIEAPFKEIYTRSRLKLKDKFC